MTRSQAIPVALIAILPALLLGGGAAARVHRHAAAHHVRHVKASQSSLAEAEDGGPPSPGSVLSAQEQQTVQLAGQNGDRNFLMIDKALGKIIVFADGKPVWSGSALTGASPADRYTRAILALPESHHFTTPEKITPAGRFTVRRTIDDEEGTVFELNGIHGNGWYLAIHRPWKGIASEHRGQRLVSADAEVKHITFGCINVSTKTMSYLLSHLPKKAQTPLYILPLDQSLTASILVLAKPEIEHTAARKRRRIKHRQIRYADSPAQAWRERRSAGIDSDR